MTVYSMPGRQKQMFFCVCGEAGASGSARRTCSGRATGSASGTCGSCPLGREI